MESTFYAVCMDENSNFPEVDEIAECFSKHFDEFGRPDPDLDIEFYKIAVGGIIDNVCSELKVYNVPVAVNIYMFTDSDEHDYTEIVDGIIDAHKNGHEVPYIPW